MPAARTAVVIRLTSTKLQSTEDPEWMLLAQSTSLVYKSSRGAEPHLSQSSKTSISDKASHCVCYFTVTEKNPSSVPNSLLLKSK